MVPLSFGFGLLAAIFAVGHISGGHFNPAVTIAMVLDKRTPAMDAVGYIIAQIIGAIAAGVVVLLAINQAPSRPGSPSPVASMTDIGALILEVVATAGFVLVILASTRRASALAALAIPLTLVAFHFALATLTGSSLNPARSIGSALVGGDLSQLWIYLVGPIDRRHHRLGRLARHRWWRRGHRPGEGAVRRSRGQRQLTPKRVTPVSLRRG